MNVNAGFRGLRHDEDMLAGDPVSTQPHVTEDDEVDDNPCTEESERTKNFSRGDQMLTTWKRQ